MKAEERINDSNDEKMKVWEESVAQINRHKT